MRTCYLGLLFVLLFARSLGAVTYYVRPDGNDTSRGRANTPRGAWRSIDRGQATLLTEDISAGATEIPVLKATQLPPRGRVLIGKTAVTYRSRTVQRLLGCRGAPDAKKGAPVEATAWRPPQPGDTVVVARGVHVLDLDGRPASLPNHAVAVVAIYAGGRPGRPVTFRGEGLPVIDAREDRDVLGVALRAPHVHFDGFDIRRGGLFVGWTRDVKVLNNRFHLGNRALSVAYSDGVEIAGNLFFDFQGAWTNHGINLGVSKKVNVHHNTVVSNNYGLRAWGGETITIANNLIAWCRQGIVFDKKQRPKGVTIANNNLWKVGRVTWLQRDDQGLDYYSDAPGAKGDIHADPKIVEWDDDQPDFLRPHASSPCVRNGKRHIGARGPAKAYPAAGNRSGENLVFNPSFESGLLGWTTDAWVGFLPGQAGWELVEDDGADGRRCLHVWDKPPEKQRINPRVMSSAFRVTRGGKLTVSFLARSAVEGSTLNVGFTMPSWQNKSGFGKNLRIGAEWKRYSVTLEPRIYYPDIMWVSLTPNRGEFWLDAVKVEEGETATPFSPSLELTVAPTPGMLIAPGEALRAEVLSRAPSEASGELRWTLFAPVTGQVASGRVAFTVAAGKRNPVALSFPKGLEGLLLLRYTLTAPSMAESRGELRFSIGAPPEPKRRHHDFIAATPPYAVLFPGELFQRQADSLAALGIGTLHLYMGYARINEMVSQSRMKGLLAHTEKAGLRWLFTPSDAAALTGKATWAPGPGNVGPEAIEVKRSDLTGGRCTPAQLKAWGEAIRLLAATFKGRIKYYEVLNEPNCFLDGDEYKKVLLTTSKALRETDPGAVIIGGSVVNALGADLYTKTLSAPKGVFDAFSYHPYRFGLPNPESERESYRTDLVRVLGDLKAAGHPAIIFHTEEGMGNGLDETRCIGDRMSYNPVVRRPAWGEGDILQSAYVSIMFATALGEGGIGYSYHTLQGLVCDALGNPQPALKALHTLATVLGDAEPMGRLKTHGDFTAYLFRLPPDKVAVAVWMKDVEYGAPLAVSLKLAPSARCRLTRMFGAREAVSVAADGTATFALDRRVAYLSCEGVTPETLKHAVEDAFGALRSRPALAASLGLPARNGAKLVCPQ